jgi:hypothetical protein
LWQGPDDEQHMTAPPPPRDSPRILQVSPERLAPWLAGFDHRHGVVLTTYDSARACFTGRDGVLAWCEPPFPPLLTSGQYEGLVSGPLEEHVTRARVVGVLLVRLGGFAAGVFEGDRLITSGVGSRPVHGRSAAGGRSQLRFARRRQLQARVAREAAADNAARVLVPSLGRIQAVVLGGDRRAVNPLRSDPRLAPLFRLAVNRFLSVPEPRLAVLRATAGMFRAVHVQLTEPARGGTSA